MRRLVICCDGTWKTANDEATTNVVRMADAVRPVGPDGVSQIVYYSAGVGTGNLVEKLRGIFGKGLENGLLDAYRFIVLNYEPGDELYLFGFSRGAYTVRSLAGLIRTAGIVRKANPKIVTEAFQVYRAPDPEGKKADKRVAVDFRAKTNAHTPNIHFIGVWDTVGSLGIPVGRILSALSRKKHGFHDTGLSSRVNNAFHALAIDEGRYTFEPTLWTSVPEPHQRVEQAWFAGAHSDVGGGNASTGLSDCAFAWMAKSARECGLGVYDEFLANEGDVQGVIQRQRWLSRFGLPDNIRDVARHPEWGERVADCAIARKGYDAPNFLDAVAKPRPASLRRPLLVRILRSLLGSNATHGRKPAAPVGAPVPSQGVR
jgi:uncharacterized protein (DUF2235 family)